MPSLRLHSLSSRIVVFFALLLAGVLAVVFVLVTTASYQIARGQNSEELAVGERVFRQLLEQNRNQLTTAARLLTSDFGFKAAVTSKDLDTVLSALDNHGRRINANLMMLVSMDGELVADTLHPERVGQKAPLGDLLGEAEAQGSAARVMRIGNEVYQVVIVPVLAPEPVAWVALGFIVNDALARSLKQLTLLDVSFLNRGTDGRWSVLASTQPAARQGTLLASFNSANAETQGTSMPAVPGYASLSSPLSEDGSVIAVLQRSIERSVAQFDPLRTTLLGLAVISLLLSILGSVFIARRITRPINALAGVARRIQQGDYSGSAEVKDSGEIGALASTLDHMRSAIASRESEIRRLAYEDTLTTLPNRSMFNVQLNQVAKLAQRSGSPFSVLVIDLDRFKNINDTLGHEAGDQVLQIVGRRLRSVVRDSDVVARFGGDEFVVLLPAADNGRVSAIVSRIQQVLTEPINLQDQPVDVGGSIGIASAPEHGTDPSVLMRRADIAMYSAKRTRSGAARYDPGLDEHRQEHLHLLGELRNAVEREELHLVYQPKVDLAQHRTVGVESLIRWEHPTRGNVPPGEFIPFAEHTGAIRQVTRWVIRTAIRQCGEWLSRGISLKVSLNVSARDLLDSELPGMVRAELEQHGVPPAMVCLEITESALMEDPVHAQETVRQLHGIGIDLSIDDYGIGHSSLAYVKNLPVNEIKIDRAFITELSSRNEDMAIVRSAVELGHNLGLRVVAEGVEEESQMRLLSDLRCDLVQGYFVSKPVSPGTLESWLSRGPWPAASSAAGQAKEARRA